MSKDSKNLRANPWWGDEGDRAKNLFAFASFIRNATRGRRQEDLHHLRLYAGSFDVDGRGTAASTRSEIKTRLRYNLSQSMVDTAVSMVGHTKPRPMYLTNEGDFGLQRQARLRTRALEGQLDDSGAYDMGPDIARDGAAIGTGTLYGYICEETQEPKVERVLPLELLVDHTEGIGGAPRTIYRQHLIPREVLMGLYVDGVENPEDRARNEKAIKSAAGPDMIDEAEFWLRRDTTLDQVVVIEGWHLGVGKDRKGGRHVMAVDTGTLVDREYTRRRLPFSHYRWSTRPVGFWGQGLVERSREAQKRIHHLAERIDEQADLGSALWIVVNGTGGVRVDHIDDSPVKVVRTEIPGSEPQIHSVNGVSQDLVQQVDIIREQAFSQEGLSIQTAESRKPAGLNSGTALRAHDDINSRRHVVNTKNFEAFYMDVVDLFEDLNDEATDQGHEPTLGARVPRGGSTIVRDIKWGTLKIPANRHRIRVFPTSLLPSTPAGKFAAVAEIIETGFISRPFAASLLDMPDIDSAMRMELADLDFVQWQVEQMLDGKPEFPESFQDLQFAQDLTRKSYLRAKADGAPDGVLENLRNYMVDVDEKLAEAAAEAAAKAADAQAAAQPSAPQGANPIAQGAPSPGPGVIAA